MKKVVYVGGSCEFCEHIFTNYPHKSRRNDDDIYVKGRAYTVVDEWTVTIDGITGTGLVTAEVELPPKWGSCSCQFRDIDGNPDGLAEMLRRHKSKPKKILEPA